MIIAVSGSCGSGKTTIAKGLAKMLDIECVELHNIAQKFKIEDVKELQTFDFDVDECLNEVEEMYLNNDVDVILEGHFAHLLSPQFVDVLVIVNRELSELKEEYISRGYNQQKIEDNLECEAFNVCFYEAEEEGYAQHQFIVVSNSKNVLVNEVIKTIKEEVITRKDFKEKNLKREEFEEKKICRKEIKKELREK